MKEIFKKVFNGLLKVENLVVSVCAIMMVTLVFFTVILRYVLQRNIQGMEELIMLFAFGVYFIGAALGSHDETQITADILSILVKKPKSTALLKMLQRGVDAVLMVICAVFSAQQLLLVVKAHSITQGLKLPMAAYYAFILCGLILVAFYSFYHCVRYGIQLARLSGHEEGVDLE